MSFAHPRQKSMIRNLCKSYKSFWKRTTYSKIKIEEAVTRKCIISRGGTATSRIAVPRTAAKNSCIKFSSYRCCCLSSDSLFTITIGIVSIIISLVSTDGLAKVKWSCRSSPTGIFPFRFTGQSIVIPRILR